VTATSIQLFYSFYHVGLRRVNLFIQIYDDDDDDDDSRQTRKTADIMERKGKKSICIAPFTVIYVKKTYQFKTLC